MLLLRTRQDKRKSATTPRSNSVPAVSLQTSVAHPTNDVAAQTAASQTPVTPSTNRVAAQNAASQTPVTSLTNEVAAQNVASHENAASRVNEASPTGDDCQSESCDYEQQETELGGEEQDPQRPTMTSKTGAAIESKVVDHQDRKRRHEETFRSHTAPRCLPRTEKFLRIEPHCFRNNSGKYME